MASEMFATMGGYVRVLVLRVIAPAVRRRLRLREDDFGPTPAA